MSEQVWTVVGPVAVTVSFPKAASEAITLPQRAVTDGSDQPAVVAVRPAGLWAGAPVRLPVDRAAAGAFERQSRLLRTGITLAWISGLFLLSQVAGLLAILLAEPSDVVVAIWFAVNVLGVLGTWAVRTVSAWRARGRVPLCYPRVRAGRIVVPAVHPATAAEWRRLDDRLTVEEPGPQVQGD